MANAIVDKPKTRAVEFFDIPVAGMNLMQVNAGVDYLLAESTAGALEDCVRRLLESAVQDGMDGSTAYLCQFALDAAAALRQSRPGSFV